MSIKLLKLDKNYVNSVGTLLSDSFMDNPLMLYFFPDESVRMKILPNIYRSVANIMMTFGTVYATSENLEGVIGVMDNKKRRVNLNMVGAIIKAVFINLPVLKYISVIDIIKKSKNILIRAVLREAKNDNLHCILQTETEENAMKYEHLGFKLYNKIESIPKELYHYVLIYNPCDDI